MSKIRFDSYEAIREQFGEAAAPPSRMNKLRCAKCAGWAAPVADEHGVVAHKFRCHHGRDILAILHELRAGRAKS